MIKSPDVSRNTESLNDKTEALLDNHSNASQKQAENLTYLSSPNISQMSPEDIQKLLFDLNTHQIELEMQNGELNRIQQELIASRDDYAQLYDASPVGYLTLDESGAIQKTNNAASSLLGCPKQELINHKLGSFIHPFDQDNYYLFIRSLSAHETEKTLSVRLRSANEFTTHLECQHLQHCPDISKPCDKNKPLTYVEFNTKVVHKNDNKFRIFIIINDITERKRAQETIICFNEKLEEKIRKQTSELTESNLCLVKKIEELRLSKHRLQERDAKLNSIFNASIEGIITIDKSDVIISANAAVETIFGYKPKELIGCSIKELMSSSPPRAMNEYSSLDPVTAKGQIKEIDGLHKNGSVVPLDLSVAEFSIDNVQYFTHIVRDVSFRKLREQQDKEHLSELAHVTRLGLMGEMASGIAHEVNQPLSAISSYTQASLNLIHTVHPDLVKLSEIIAKTQEQALRAGRIIHRMRAFVKHHSIHRSTSDINILIHDAVGLCTAEIKQNNILLLFELEDNLQPIYVDHIQIEQVLINLIRNSIDALQNLPENQCRKLTIQSHLTLNNFIQVRIKDNGPGLNEDQLHKILTPFYTTKADGMGMGLSISRSLIESHEGELHFNSEPGKGTTFYFTLPIRRKPDESKLDES